MWSGGYFSAISVYAIRGCVVILIQLLSHAARRLFSSHSSVCDRRSCCLHCSATQSLQSCGQEPFQCRRQEAVWSFFFNSGMLPGGYFPVIPVFAIKGLVVILLQLRHAACGRHCLAQPLQSCGQNNFSVGVRRPRQKIQVRLRQHNTRRLLNSAQSLSKPPFRITDLHR